MKYIFRGHVIFEYIPEQNIVIQHKVNDVIPAFDYCRFIVEDYMLLSEFFGRAYKHASGKYNHIGVILDDIVVN